MSTDGKWNPDKMRVDIAKNLREIKRLCLDLREEVTFHAADKDLPGGAAMVLLGPSTDPEAWNYRQISAAIGRTGSHGLYDFDSDPQPPLLVLATWEDAIRAELQTPSNKRANINDAADYIGSSVNWMLDTNEYGDMNFLAIDDLDADLAKTRAQLENVLKAGYRLTRIKARCMYCTKSPRLAVRFMDDESKDHWRCPNKDCGHLYDVDGVRRCLHHSLHIEGEGAWVTLTDAAQSTGRSVRTLRTWVNPPVPYEPKLKAIRNPRTQRIEVWWPAVRDLSNDTPTRRRSA